MNMECSQDFVMKLNNQKNKKYKMNGKLIHQLHIQSVFFKQIKMILLMIETKKLYRLLMLKVKRGGNNIDIQ
jgi:hypothetical protein